jgi:hypothetical protein
VYKHGEKGNYYESEVTTNQESWVTVDYIFYRLVVHGTIEVSCGKTVAPLRYSEPSSGLI